MIFLSCLFLSLTAEAAVKRGREEQQDELEFELAIESASFAPQKLQDFIKHPNLSYSALERSKDGRKREIRPETTISARQNLPLQRFRRPQSHVRRRNGVAFFFTLDAEAPLTPNEKRRKQISRSLGSKSSFGLRGDTDRPFSSPLEPTAVKCSHKMTELKTIQFSIFSASK